VDGSLSGKGAVPVTRNATPLPKFYTPYIDPLNHIQIGAIAPAQPTSGPAATAHGVHPNRTSGICTLCRNSTVAPHFGVTAR
jgi:hypothetical protein